MSMVYDTLQRAQARAGAPGSVSVVPPALFTVREGVQDVKNVWVLSLAGILTGVLIGLLLVG